MKGFMIIQSFIVWNGFGSSLLPSGFPEGDGGGAAAAEKPELDVLLPSNRE